MPAQGTVHTLPPRRHNRFHHHSAAVTTLARNGQPEAISTDSEAVAESLMQDFRSAAEAVGQCLHLNHMGTSKPATIVGRKVREATMRGQLLRSMSHILSGSQFRITNEDSNARAASASTPGCIGH